MKLTVGQALVSRTDSTHVVVVRAPDREIEIACGGPPMADAKSADADAARQEPAAEWLNGSLVGKRYISSDEETEVLCTRPGPASLAVDGVPMDVKAAKSLPSSD
ncbi:hypothetical protein [Cumulibacter soli]|uniref:hypothetical protein n=1 Tax=Cumulibacter soli TaxID=2546344 RepID=UPI0010677245|nr:hypothetical protein [Cumulibacter soli]